MMFSQRAAWFRFLPLLILLARPANGPAADSIIKISKTFHFPDQFAQISSECILFTALSNTTHTWQLWRTDATPEGTNLITDLPGSVMQMQAADGLAYFKCPTGVWKSDGTLAGTVRIEENAIGTISQIRVIARDKIFFTILRGTGRELWFSNGTTSGTVLLKGLPEGAVKATVTLSWSVWLQGRLLFTCIDDDSIYWLWSTDGTPEGTMELMKMNTGLDNRAALVNGTLYFPHNPNFLPEEDIWATDGTPAGTGAVKSFNDEYGLLFLLSIPDGKTLLYGLGRNDVHVFHAYDSVTRHDEDLGDFPAPGVQLIERAACGKRLCFFGSYFDSSFSNFLMTSDGTVEGTYPITPKVPAFKHVADLVSFEDRLFFAAEIEFSGEPTYAWISDGTPGGTRKFFTLDPTTATFPDSDDHYFMGCIHHRIPFIASDSGSIGQNGTIFVYTPESSVGVWQQYP